MDRWMDGWRNGKGGDGSGLQDWEDDCAVQVVAFLCLTSVELGGEMCGKELQLRISGQAQDRHKQVQRAQGQAQHSTPRKKEEEKKKKEWRTSRVSLSLRPANGQLHPHTTPDPKTREGPIIFVFLFFFLFKLSGQTHAHSQPGQAAGQAAGQAVGSWQLADRRTHGDARTWRTWQLAAGSKQMRLANSRRPTSTTTTAMAATRKSVRTTTTPGTVGFHSCRSCHTRQIPLHESAEDASLAVSIRYMAIDDEKKNKK